MNGCSFNIRNVKNYNKGIKQNTMPISKVSQSNLPKID